MAPKPFSLPEQWNTAIAAWESHLRLRGFTDATRKVRRSHVRGIARWSGAPSPADIAGPRLAALCGERPSSIEYRKSLRASLRSFYGYCLDAGIVADDPTTWLPPVKPPSTCPRPATDQTWAHLLVSAPPRERLMARLAGEAGLRRAEVARAHRDDLIPDGDDWSLIVHGKGGKQRIVPLTENLAAEISAWRQEGYLFPGSLDGHVSVTYVGQLISRLMPPGWSMHALRHRMASRGYAGTHDLRAVQEALGHASVATTQRYTAVAARDIRAVIEAAAPPGLDLGYRGAVAKREVTAGELRRRAAELLAAADEMDPQ